jgi:hemerythrin-like domain-containing protein
MSHHSHAHTHGHPHEAPTAVLVEEHELILRALEALEKTLDRLEQGGIPDRAFFEKMVEFLRTFADACHHGKEERLLFEHMVKALGFPRQAGPIAVMLSDHEAGRGFVRGMAEAAGRLGADPAASAMLIENGRGYVQLLRSHIQRENGILFPMAEARMGPEDRAHLLEAFERFEAEETGAGVHERAVALLDELVAAA